MKTFLKDEIGCTGSITDLKDGTARLIVRIPNGQKIHGKIHKSRKAARQAWSRMGN